MKPFNIKIMDVDAFIKDKNVLQISSPFIKDVTTGNFDVNGLFSELIFGEMGSSDRLIKMGYIKLNCTLMHPVIYKSILKMKGLYSNIVSGKAYAVFDIKTKDFLQAASEDENAETGYSFFMKHVEELKFKQNDSEARTNRIHLIEKNKDKWFITKSLVEPAGIREYREQNGRAEYDDVNKLYKRIIEVANTLEGAHAHSAIFDTVRYTLQRTVVEIYDYLWDNLFNKYMQDKFVSRSIARASRNAISAVDISSSDDNPEAELQPDETFIPLGQVMNMYAPLVKNKLRAYFFNNVFSDNSNQAALVEPATLDLKYITVSMEEKAKYIKSNEMDKLLNEFLDEELRHLPFTIIGEDKKPYYLWLKYIKDDFIYLGRSKSELIRLLISAGVIKEGDNVDSNISPMTYYEIYYIVTSVVVENKYTTVTRYPVTHHLSIYPSKVHVITTIDYTRMKLVSISDLPETKYMVLSRWPVNKSASINSIGLHPSQLINLGADHDGDKVNVIGVYSEEANNECKEYLNSPKSMIDPSGLPTIRISSDLAKVTVYNLTKDA